jgi:hypothetical protein
MAAAVVMVAAAVITISGIRTSARRPLSCLT